MTSARPRVAFVVNGDQTSPMADRAAEFSSGLDRAWEIHTIFRDAGRYGSILSMRGDLEKLRPALIYVLDMGVAGTVASQWHKVRQTVPVIIDTGDAIHALSRTMRRGRIIGLATRLLERSGLRFADHIVVRGTFHGECLARQGIEATVIQDGVNVEAVFAKVDPEAKQKNGQAGRMTCGMVGSLRWNDNTQTCYGMELIRALVRLNSLPIAAVIVGDGDALPRLRKLAEDNELEDQVIFTGYQKGDDLYQWLGAIDVCVSTQTNDLVGQVRTTGKLALYMAAGRYILATDVGEAKLVLEEDMLIPYNGSHDPKYAANLASRLKHLCQNQGLLSRGNDLVEVAERHFSYDKLSLRLHEVMSKTIVGALRS